MYAMENAIVNCDDRRMCGEHEPCWRGMRSSSYRETWRALCVTHLQMSSSLAGHGKVSEWIIWESIIHRTRPDIGSLSRLALHPALDSVVQTFIPIQVVPHQISIMFFTSSADNIHLDNGVLYASSQKKGRQAAAGARLSLILTKSLKTTMAIPSPGGHQFTLDHYCAKTGVGRQVQRARTQFH
jgi:hypothetical protein